MSDSWKRFPAKEEAEKTYVVIIGPSSYLLCPKCGKRTKTKALPNTKVKNFPLWCPWCKKQFIIDL